jgi:hypothetical protein
MFGFCDCRSSLFSQGGQGRSMLGVGWEMHAASGDAWVMAQAYRSQAVVREGRWECAALPGCGELGVQCHSCQTAACVGFVALQQQGW